MNTVKTIISGTLILLGVVTFGTVYADDEGYPTGGYDGGYLTGGYDGGYTVGGYDGGYVTGGYDNGFLTNGYDGGYLTGGYDGGYVTDGYDGGYVTGGYDGGYVTDGYDGGYITNGYDGGYVTDGYDGGILGCDSWCYSDYVSDCGGCGYSYKGSSGGGYYSGGSGYSTPRYTSGGSYSSPISVSSGRSYAQPSTPVVVSGGGTTHNNNNNINNNTNVNNINVSATAIAIAPAPVATPVAAYIPPPVYTHPAPYCTISVTNTYGIGYYGGQQTLNWNSTNAHSASISPVIGSVSTNGSRIVSNLGGQVYTMTVWGPGGSATCQTQPMYIPPVHVPTPTPYVALTQIPYTGFDFGPVGNALYWASLISVALLGAYLVVYFRGGALAFANSMLGGRSEARSSRLAEFTPLPESAFVSAKKTVARAQAKVGYTGTFDTMSFAHSKDGVPKIVINRA